MLFRRIVGLVITNSSNQIFIGQRSAYQGTHEGWQMPQGGIEAGESLTAAAFREMREEIGTDRGIVREILKEALIYKIPAEINLPDGYARCILSRWVHIDFTGDVSDIRFDAQGLPEFCDGMWASPEEVLTRIVPFKRIVYTRVLSSVFPFFF